MTLRTGNEIFRARLRSLYGRNTGAAIVTRGLKGGGLRPRKYKRGFTLVEIMAATAVLSLGIISIYQALFITLDAFTYCANYFEVSPQINERIWQTQEDLKRFGPEAKVSTGGVFMAGEKQLPWELSYVIVDVSSDLYKIDLSTSWKSGKRTVQISRSAYALYKNEDGNETE